MHTDYLDQQGMASLRPGDHLGCIYADESQRRAALMPFIRDGLERGQKVVYAYDDQPPAALLDALSQAGAACDQALASGQLLLLANQTFAPPGGGPDPLAVLAWLEQACALLQTQGYTALRFTGDMAWACRLPPGAELSLSAYEARLQALCTAQPLILLCQYNRAAAGLAVLLEALQAHPRLALGASLTENFYYLPPTAAQDPEAARFDRWMENLAHRGQAQAALSAQLEQIRRDISRRVGEQIAHMEQANEQLYQGIRQRLGIEYALIQANEALRETESRYKTIFDAATDAIFIQALDGRFIEVNQVACERFGYSREELVNLRTERIIAPEQREQQAAWLASLRAKDAPHTCETELVTRDGRHFPAEVKSRRIQYQNNGAFLSIARDITERKLAEQSLRESAAHLRESEAKFRSLIENSPDGITLSDENGRIVEYNHACERIFNIPAAQALGRSPTDVYFATLPDSGRATPEVYAWSEARLRQVCQTGQADWLGSLRDYEIQQPGGERRFIQSLCFPIPTARGFMLGTIDRDVTPLHHTEQELEQYRQHLESMVQQRTAALEYEVREREQVEAELLMTNQALAVANAGLRESEERYRVLVNHSPSGIMVIQDGRYVFVNPAVEQRLGYAPGEMTGLDFLASIAADTRALARMRLEPVDQNDPAAPVVLQFICKDGSLLYSETTTTPIVYGGSPAALVIGQDVTERLRYEQQLEASLAEKEVMLREIHHRVKNNLNVITALIDLQKAGISDPQALQVFKELQTRTYTMALVHESLYRSPNLAKIDFSSFLRTLVDHLYAAYGPAIGSPCSAPVMMRVDADSLVLKVETAIPCSLIVNELVTNALKYAFPSGVSSVAGQGCQVLVRLRSAATAPATAAAATAAGVGGLTLEVSDNGVGLPAGLDWRAVSTLGLQLIQVLARQLGGEISLASGPGVTWQITFTERT